MLLRHLRRRWRGQINGRRGFVARVGGALPPLRRFERGPRVGKRDQFGLIRTRHRQQRRAQSESAVPPARHCGGGAALLRLPQRLARRRTRAPQRRQTRIARGRRIVAIALPQRARFQQINQRAPALLHRAIAGRVGGLRPRRVQRCGIGARQHDLRGIAHRRQLLVPRFLLCFVPRFVR